MGAGVRTWCAVALVALALVGCSSSGTSLDTVPPLDTTAPTAAPTSGSTAAPTTVAATAPATSPAPATVVTDPTTTVASSATADVATTVVDDGVARLSDDGPWTLVDSAPGVTTPGLIYELMPKLWVFLPTEELPDDDSSLFVPSPEDIPIIEAYLRATATYFRAVSHRPIDLGDPGWTQDYADGGERYRAALGPRRDAGEALDLDSGVVTRPFVVGDERTETQAVVFDCELDGAVWRHDDGSLAAGSTLGVVRHGVVATLAFEAGRWIVDRVADQDDACV